MAKITVFKGKKEILSVENVPRWGVHERGYFWFELEQSKKVRLKIFPMSEYWFDLEVEPEEVVYETTDNTNQQG